MNLEDDAWRVRAAEEHEVDWDFIDQAAIRADRDRDAADAFDDDLADSY